MIEESNELRSGLKTILKQLSTNCKDTTFCLTHKEVRTYAKCLLVSLTKIDIDPEVRQKIQVLLVCMSSGGLSIDNRNFLAKQALEALQKDEIFSSSPKIPTPENF